VLFCNKRNNFYSNELNEVVISDSKLLWQRKVRKGNCKITSENCLRNQVNLLLLKVRLPVLKLTETRVVQVKLRLLH
jgi:hypothetical protein